MAPMRSLVIASLRKKLSLDVCFLWMNGLLRDCTWRMWFFGGWLALILLLQRMGHFAHACLRVGLITGPNNGCLVTPSRMKKLGMRSLKGSGPNLPARAYLNMCQPRSSNIFEKVLQLFMWRKVKAFWSRIDI